MTIKKEISGISGSVKNEFNEIKEFSVGFPSAFLLCNNNILACYYAGDHKDFTHIEWASLIAAN